jgi:hypothetical protein
VSFCTTRPQNLESRFGAMHDPQARSGTLNNTHDAIIIIIIIIIIISSVGVYILL